MPDTIIGRNPEATCDDCGRKGINGSHCGPLVPVGSGWVSMCGKCFSDRDADYNAGIPPKAVGCRKEGSVWARGMNDCHQDRCENIPFASIGGLDHRNKPAFPVYIKPEEQEEYWQGYQWCAHAMFGPEWRTCEFTWKPALVIP